MGVSQIWELIRNSQETRSGQPPQLSPYYQRVPFKTFLVEEKPKIAIDAYHILFECGFFQFDQLGKPILNLLKRLKELIALDASFILVFDGLEKPVEKNDNNNMINYRSHPKFMSTIHKLFKLLNISMVQARGEGEVQCCVLEKQGKIDLIWTNDSDCLLFGGNHIMKNYSKYDTDIGVAPGASSPRRSGTDNSNSGRENFITILKYNELLKEHCSSLLDRESLLLFSILLGADYHTQGVKGLGKDKSYKVASLKDPNFAQKFYQIFESSQHGTIWDIQYKYETFQKELFAYCQRHSVDLFGKNYSVLLNNPDANFDNWPPVSIINHYFHPLKDEDVDIGTLLDEDKYLNVQGSSLYEEIEFDELYSFLNTLKLPQITNFDRWFHDTMHEMCLLKYLLYDGGCDSKCKITEEKIVIIDDNINNIIKYWKVRYNSFLPGVKASEGNRTRSSSPKRSPTRRQIDIQEYKNSVWIPQDCLPEAHILVHSYRERERERLKREERDKKLKNNKRSPKKRFANYTQKNNLDTFFTKHAHVVDKNMTSLTLLRSDSSSLSTPDPDPEEIRLESMKKRLFMGSSDEDETVDGDGVEQGDHALDNDSSLVIVEEKNIDTKQAHLNLRDNVLKPLRSEEPSRKPSPTKKTRPASHPSVLRPPVKLTGVTKQLSFNENDKILGNTYSNSPIHTGLNVSPVVNRSHSITLDKPAPMLSHTDTFGHKKVDRSSSLLDRITDEADGFLREMEAEGNHSDTSTISTLSSSSLSP